MAEFEPQVEIEKRENVVAGAVGAFLGSLLGVACIVIIGQMGYVASVCGLVMAVCSLKGYELLGGGMSKKGRRSRRSGGCSRHWVVWAAAL